MGALRGLLEAAEWVAKEPRLYDEAAKAMKLERGAGIAPALRGLVGPAMEAEKPGLELSRRLAMEELLNAKQAAKSAKKSLLPKLGTMSQKDKLAYEAENPGGIEKLKHLVSGAGPVEGDIDDTGKTGSAVWLKMNANQKANLYRKSGMAKIMSFHESQPEKLSQLLSAAEEAGRGVEGGVEPTLALPSVAHQSAERVAKEGKLPDNFGKTALIFGPESVKPGLKDVNTFDADAYLYRRPKNFEKTREGQEVSWIGRREKAFKEDPNLILLDTTSPRKSKLSWGSGNGPAPRDRQTIVYELPKDVDRSMVIDAFKLGPDDYAKNAKEYNPGLYKEDYTNNGKTLSLWDEQMLNKYPKPFSTEDAENYSLAQLWDERTKKNVWVKLPKREEDLATYGFVPSKKETTSFPDMEHREGGRWIPTNDPEAMRQHIKESAGDLRFTEGLQHGISNPSGFSGARAKYATEIKSEKQLRASLGSFKHQKIPYEQRRKLEDAGDDFFKMFRSEGSQEAIRNTPPEESFEAFTSDKAHEYLSKLEKEGTGGNPTLDKLGLQYLAFMKSVPSDYYEAKIFRHVPIKEAKALYMPIHNVHEGEEVLRLVKQYQAEGHTPERAWGNAIETGVGYTNYEAKHSAILLQAMKKRGIPVVSDIGDLLKHAWVVPVIGPGAAYIAGDKSSQKK